MNWYDLPDNEFDSLFKKASESVDFPFREEAWQKMERRLNQWEIFSSIYWRLLNGVVILMAVVGSILLYSYKGLDQKIFNAGNPVISKKDIQFNSLEAGTSPALAENSNLPVEAENKENASFIDAPAPLKTINSSGKGHRQDNNILTEEKLKDPVTGPSLVRIETHFEAPERRTIEASRFEKAVKLTEYSSNIHGIRNLEPESRIISSDYKFIMAEAPENKQGTDEIIPSYRSLDRKIAFTVSVGPDFSGVFNAGFGTGTFTGLGLEVLLLNRISLMTGINHSRKRYSVSEGYEVPYETYGSYVHPPDKVNIACHVIDIPINLYYSIIDNGKNRVFAGTGISSYLMLTEEYKFDYGYYNDPNLIKEYTINNENQHFLGIINISAGYARNINDKWTWQIEPYYKLPVQDIAAAQIRLNSYGALFTLKYWFR